uniref:Uncharacterized protein n=1 Tax=Nelumbo nucifera TaxID=4432 RepID=A0A822XZJ9_NELNU|nr:TPA_asm: hypothetical protein HUJ06_026105 [Nelumbo nucifera]
MLNIFKNYEIDVSILDDFDFYEDHQKTIQERKKQQANLMVVPIVGGNEHQNPVSLSSDFIKQMTKRFAQVVRLEESGKEDLITEKGGSTVAAAMGAGVKS